MIFGNIEQIKEFGFLPENLLESLQYALNHDLKKLQKGSYPIDKERFFVNIVEYETTTEDKRFWEAHKKYYDVHFMLDGEEQIDLNFISNMEQKEFKEEEDFLALEGVKNAQVVLRKGDFLICYPDDGHRTAIAVNEPAGIKKAIFKVRIE